jgi:BirA family transcriptional regulator, biotin operon repressor / biotin---[acetyl-CoA-carboxylase] ligase
VRWLSNVTSTTTELFEGLDDWTASNVWPRLLGAHHQSAGQGRRGKQWLDRPGQTLMFSCGFMLSEELLPRFALHALSPAIGVSTASCLNQYLTDAEPIRLKWPNDLIYGHGKLAGILVQTRIRGSDVLVVVSMGMNLAHDTSLADTLQRTVAAWPEKCTDDSSWSTMVRDIALSWRDSVEVFNRQGFVPFREKCAQLDYLYGHAVRIFDGERIVDEGYANGLSGTGELILESASGIKTIAVGDLSVRLQQTHQD